MIDSDDPAIINTVIANFTRENERLIDRLYQLQYYWRGALTRDDIWAMCPTEVAKATEFINNRFTEIGVMMKKGITVSY